MVSQSDKNKLFEQLESVGRKSSFDKFLLRYASAIDDIDMYLGPFSEATMLSNSEMMNNVGGIAQVVQYGIKVPFVAMYLTRTGNFSALYNWIPLELFSVAIPYGGFIEVFRNYENTAFKHFKEKYERKGIDKNK